MILLAASPLTPYVPPLTDILDTTGFTNLNSKIDAMNAAEQRRLLAVLNELNAREESRRREIRARLRPVPVPFPWARARADAIPWRRSRCDGARYRRRR